MKRLFLAVCTVATLASCSMDEVVSYDKGEVIGFANPFVNKSTRAATDPSYNGTGTLDRFQVWGTANDLAIYDGDDVTGTVGGGEWTCTEKNYWVKGVEYDFAALAGYGAATVGLTTNGLPTSITDFDASAANVDLIYATATETGADSNNAVALTFYHLLSKVKFTVKNNSTAEDLCSFKITNVTINGKKIGTATLSAVGATPATATWDTSSAAAADYTISDITVGSGVASVECASELLLIPGSFDISFSVETYYNGNMVDTKDYSSSSVPALTQTLAVGTAYNFIINVSVGNEIKFSVAANPSWTDADVNGTTIL
ncbi:MAG: fimbrillin family protein [Alistipes sp.]|nr:fimbrillin family protein [Alistipes sp.]